MVLLAIFLNIAGLLPQFWKIVMEYFIAELWNHKGIIKRDRIAFLLHAFPIPQELRVQLSFQVVKEIWSVRIVTLWWWKCKYPGWMVLPFRCFLDHHNFITPYPHLLSEGHSFALQPLVVSWPIAWCSWGFCGRASPVTVSDGNLGTKLPYSCRNKQCYFSSLLLHFYCSSTNTIETLKTTAVLQGIHRQWKWVHNFLA